MVLIGLFAFFAFLITAADSSEESGNEKSSSLTQDILWHQRALWEENCDHADEYGEGSAEEDTVKLIQPVKYDEDDVKLSQPIKSEDGRIEELYEENTEVSSVILVPLRMEKYLEAILSGETKDADLQVHDPLLANHGILDVPKSLIQDTNGDLSVTEAEYKDKGEPHIDLPDTTNEVMTEEAAVIVHNLEAIVQHPKTYQEAMVVSMVQESQPLNQEPELIVSEPESSTQDLFVPVGELEAMFQQPQSGVQQQDVVDETHFLTQQSDQILDEHEVPVHIIKYQRNKPGIIIEEHKTIALEPKPDNDHDAINRTLVEKTVNLYTELLVPESEVTDHDSAMLCQETDNDFEALFHQPKAASRQHQSTIEETQFLNHDPEQIVQEIETLVQESDCEIRVPTETSFLNTDDDSKYLDLYSSNLYVEWKSQDDGVEIQVPEGKSIDFFEENTEISSQILVPLVMEKELEALMKRHDNILDNQGTLDVPETVTQKMGNENDLPDIGVEYTQDSGEPMVVDEQQHLVIVQQPQISAQQEALLDEVQAFTSKPELKIQESVAKVHDSVILSKEPIIFIDEHGVMIQQLKPDVQQETIVEETQALTPKPEYLASMPHKLKIKGHEPIFPIQQSQALNQEPEITAQIPDTNVLESEGPTKVLMEESSRHSEETDSGNSDTDSSSVDDCIELSKWKSLDDRIDMHMSDVSVDIFEEDTEVSSKIIIPLEMEKEFEAILRDYTKHPHMPHDVGPEMDVKLVTVATKVQDTRMLVQEPDVCIQEPYINVQDLDVKLQTKIQDTGVLVQGPDVLVDKPYTNVHESDVLIHELDVITREPDTIVQELNAVEEPYVIDLGPGVVPKTSKYITQELRSLVQEEPVDHNTVWEIIKTLETNGQEPDSIVQELDTMFQEPDPIVKKPDILVQELDIMDQGMKSVIQDPRTQVPDIILDELPAITEQSKTENCHPENNVMIEETKFISEKPQVLNQEPEVTAGGSDIKVLESKGPSKVQTDDSYIHIEDPHSKHSDIDSSSLDDGMVLSEWKSQNNRKVINTAEHECLDIFEEDTEVSSLILIPEGMETELEAILRGYTKDPNMPYDIGPELEVKLLTPATKVIDTRWLVQEPDVLLQEPYSNIQESNVAQKLGAIVLGPGAIIKKSNFSTQEPMSLVEKESVSQKSMPSVWEMVMNIEDKVIEPDCVIQDPDTIGQETVPIQTKQYTIVQKPDALVQVVDTKDQGLMSTIQDSGIEASETIIDEHQFIIQQQLKAGNQYQDNMIEETMFMSEVPQALKQEPEIRAQELVTKDIKSKCPTQVLKEDSSSDRKELYSGHSDTNSSSLNEGTELSKWKSQSERIRIKSAEYECLDIFEEDTEVSSQILIPEGMEAELEAILRGYTIDPNMLYDIGPELEAKLLTPATKVQDTRLLVHEPDVLLQKPCSDIEEPNAMVLGPGAIIKTSKSTTQEPLSLVEEELMVQKSTSCIWEMGTNIEDKVQEPDSMIQEPDPMPQKADPIVKKPDIIIQKLDTLVQVPDTMGQGVKSKIQYPRTETLDIIIDEYQTIPQQPNTTNHYQENIVEETQLISEEPQALSQELEIMAHEPFTKDLKSKSPCEVLTEDSLTDQKQPDSGHSDTNTSSLDEGMELFKWKSQDERIEIKTAEPTCVEIFEEYTEVSSQILIPIGMEKELEAIMRGYTKDPHIPYDIGPELEAKLLAPATKAQDTSVLVQEPAILLQEPHQELDDIDQEANTIIQGLNLLQQPNISKTLKSITQEPNSLVKEIKTEVHDPDSMVQELNTVDHESYPLVQNGVQEQYSTFQTIGITEDSSIHLEESDSGCSDAGSSSADKGKSQDDRIEIELLKDESTGVFEGYTEESSQLVIPLGMEKECETILRGYNKDADMPSIMDDIVSEHLVQGQDCMNKELKSIIQEPASLVEQQPITLSQTPMSSSVWENIKEIETKVQEPDSILQGPNTIHLERDSIIQKQCTILPPEPDAIDQGLKSVLQDSRIHVPNAIINEIEAISQQPKTDTNQDESMGHETDSMVEEPEAHTPEYKCFDSFEEDTEISAQIFIPLGMEKEIEAILRDYSKDPCMPSILDDIPPELEAKLFVPKTRVHDTKSSDEEPGVIAQEPYTNVYDMDKSVEDEDNASSSDMSNSSRSYLRSSIQGDDLDAQKLASHDNKIDITHPEDEEVDLYDEDIEMSSQILVPLEMEKELEAMLRGYSKDSNISMVPYVITKWVEEDHQPTTIVCDLVLINETGVTALVPDTMVSKSDQVIQKDESIKPRYVEQELMPLTQELIYLVQEDNKGTELQYMDQEEELIDHAIITKELKAHTNIEEDPVREGSKTDVSLDEDSIQRKLPTQDDKVLIKYPEDELENCFEDSEVSSQCGRSFEMEKELEDVVRGYDKDSEIPETQTIETLPQIGNDREDVMVEEYEENIEVPSVIQQNLKVAWLSEENISDNTGSENGALEVEQQHESTLSKVESQSINEDITEEPEAIFLDLDVEHRSTMEFEEQPESESENSISIRESEVSCHESHISQVEAALEKETLAKHPMSSISMENNLIDEAAVIMDIEKDMFKQDIKLAEEDQYIKSLEVEDSGLTILENEAQIEIPYAVIQRNQALLITVESDDDSLPEHQAPEDEDMKLFQEPVQNFAEMQITPSLDQETIGQNLSEDGSIHSSQVVPMEIQDENHMSFTEYNKDTLIHKAQEHGKKYKSAPALVLGDNKEQHPVLVIEDMGTASQVQVSNEMFQQSEEINLNLVYDIHTKERENNSSKEGLVQSEAEGIVSKYTGEPTGEMHPEMVGIEHIEYEIKEYEEMDNAPEAISLNVYDQENQPLETRNQTYPERKIENAEDEDVLSKEKETIISKEESPSTVYTQKNGHQEDIYQEIIIPERKMEHMPDNESQEFTDTFKEKYGSKYSEVEYEEDVQIPEALVQQDIDQVKNIMETETYSPPLKKRGLELLWETSSEDDTEEEYEELGFPEVLTQDRYDQEYFPLEGRTLISQELELSEALAHGMHDQEYQTLKRRSLKSPDLSNQGEIEVYEDIHILQAFILDECEKESPISGRINKNSTKMYNQGDDSRHSTNQTFPEDIKEHQKYETSVESSDEIQVSGYGETFQVPEVIIQYVGDSTSSHSMSDDSEADIINKKPKRFRTFIENSGEEGDDELSRSGVHEEFYQGILLPGQTGVLEESEEEGNNLEEISKLCQQKSGQSDSVSVPDESAKEVVTPEGLKVPVFYVNELSNLSTDSLDRSQRFANISQPLEPLSDSEVGHMYLTEPTEHPHTDSFDLLEPPRFVERRGSISSVDLDLSSVSDQSYYMFDPVTGLDLREIKMLPSEGNVMVLSSDNLENSYDKEMNMVPSGGSSLNRSVEMELVKSSNILDAPLDDGLMFPSGDNLELQPGDLEENQSGEYEKSDEDSEVENARSEISFTYETLESDEIMKREQTFTEMSTKLFTDDLDLERGESKVIVSKEIEVKAFKSYDYSVKTITTVTKISMGPDGQVMEHVLDEYESQDDYAETSATGTHISSVEGSVQKAIDGSDSDDDIIHMKIPGGHESIQTATEASYSELVQEETATKFKLKQLSQSGSQETSKWKDVDFDMETRQMSRSSSQGSLNSIGVDLDMKSKRLSQSSSQGSLKWKVVDIDMDTKQRQSASEHIYITDGLIDQIVYVHSNFALTVEVTAENAQVTWYLDDIDLIPENSDKYSFVCEYKRHVLHVHDACFDDEGEYSCVVGTDRTQGYITVLDGKV